MVRVWKANLPCTLISLTNDSGAGVHEARTPLQHGERWAISHLISEGTPRVTHGCHFLGVC